MIEFPTFMRRDVWVERNILYVCLQLLLLWESKCVMENTHSHTMWETREERRLKGEALFQIDAFCFILIKFLVTWLKMVGWFDWLEIWLVHSTLVPLWLEQLVWVLVELNIIYMRGFVSSGRGRFKAVWFWYNASLNCWIVRLSDLVETLIYC